jgi:toxin ParE1/3/4
MKRIRVTHDAERDLDEIWLHIAPDNVDAANRLVDELIKRFVLISASPELGRVRDEIRPGLRSHAVNSYVVYYRNTRTNISIMRVVHGARDPKRVFKLK